MDIQQRNEEILSWFNHFHANAEISWQEFNTTKTLAAFFEAQGISYYTFDDVTGVIAEIGEGDEVIAIRADIDALWQEVDGVMQANHSCGHDANMAMVLGAMLELRHTPLQKRIRFIFQPAEETGGGALAMVERGVMQDVTHLFGVHLRPQDELPLGKIAPAIYHGAGAFLQGTIKGADAHGARPHQGQNAIDVLVAIHMLTKTIYMSPAETYSVKVTKMVADGGSVNIIPGAAQFSLDVRAQKNEVLEALIAKIEHGLQSIQAQYAINMTWDWDDITPGAEVSQEALELATTAITQTFGDAVLAEAIVTPGSDDFHFYTIKCPHVKAAMIAVGANLTPGLHHPQMTFDQRALFDGATAVAATLRTAATIKQLETV